MIIQLQSRTLCPEWLKIRAKDSSHQAARAHHGNCPLQCGWGEGENWVYRFLPLDELREMLALPPAGDELIPTPEAAPPAAPPAKRTRKSKAEMVVTKETGVKVVVEDLVDDLDDRDDAVQAYDELDDL